MLVHFASVWVPFTSEGKEAIAAYPEIIKDIKLAIQDAGRKLAGFVRSQRKSREGQMRRQLFERYIPVVAESLEKLTGKDKGTIETKLEAVVKSGKINIEAQAAEAEKETKQKKITENESEEE
jgi:DNA topoisomerase-6 subunit B